MDPAGSADSNTQAEGAAECTEGGVGHGTESTDPAETLKSDTPAAEEASPGQAESTEGGVHAAAKKRVQVNMATTSTKRAKVSRTKKSDSTADGPSPAHGPSSAEPKKSKTKKSASTAASSAPAHGSSTAEPQQGQRVCLAKIPRGLPVFAEVEPMPPPWKPGDPLGRPTLISFRNLLWEQYTDDQLLGREPPEGRQEAGSVESGQDELASSSARSSQPAAHPTTEALRNSDSQEDVTAERGTSNTEAKGANKEPSILDSIGKRDHWGDVIRSLENRLERQGIVAAPDTFVRKKKKPGGTKKKTARTDDRYYDADDAFIDDSGLEELNEAMEEPTPSATAKGAAHASSEHRVVNMAGSSVGTELDPHVASYLDGFRLTSNEVSGTSEESASDQEEEQLLESGLVVNPWKREDRGWNHQLTGLRDELIPVRAGVPLVDDGVERLGSVRKSLAAITDVLSSFCTAVESAVATQMAKLGQRKLQPAGKPDPEQLETALSMVYRKLPPLLRITRQEPGLQGPAEKRHMRNQRWKLHHLEAKLPGQGQDEASGEATAEMANQGEDASKQHEVLPWSEAEELAWCCLLWKLTTEPGLAPGMSKTSFIRSWLSATKTSQQEVLLKARQDVGITLQDMMTRCRQPIMDAVQNWQHLRDEDANKKSDDDSEKNSNAQKLGVLTRGAAMRPVVACLRNVRLVWNRQRLWQDQRQANRVKLAFSNPTDRQMEQNAVAVYFSTLLHEYTGLTFPLELLTALLRSKQKLPVAHATSCATPKVQQNAAIERRRFVASLATNSWVSCRYAGQWREFLGVPLNAQISNSVDASDGFPESRNFDLEYVVGDRQYGVDIESIQPPIIWKVGDTVEYKNGSRWYACRIIAMQEQGDPERVTYSVTDAEANEVLGITLAHLRPKLLDSRGTGGKAAKKDMPKQPKGKPKASPKPKMAPQPKPIKQIQVEDKVSVAKKGIKLVGKVISVGDDGSVSVQCDKEVITCPLESATLISKHPSNSVRNLSKEIVEVIEL